MNSYQTDEISIILNSKLLKFPQKNMSKDDTGDEHNKQEVLQLT